MTRLPSMSSPPSKAVPGSPSAEIDPARLLALLSQQCLLYDQLLDFSKQQAACIQDGRTEALLAVLAQRQRVLTELAAINDELTPCRGKWAQVRQALPPAQKQQMVQMLDKAEQQLARIIQQDEQDRLRLQQSRAQVGGELTRMNRASSAAAAYRPAPAPGSQNRFTSKQG